MSRKKDASSFFRLPLHATNLLGSEMCICLYLNSEYCMVLCEQKILKIVYRGKLQFRGNLSFWIYSLLFRNSFWPIQYLTEGNDSDHKFEHLIVVCVCSRRLCTCSGH